MDAEKKRNLGVRVASAVVLFPLAVWLTFVGGVPFAILASVAGAIAGLELVLMFGTVGAAELFGVVVSGLLPLSAVWGDGHLLPGWAGMALASAMVVLLVLVLFRRAPLETIPRSVGVVTTAWLYCGLLLATIVGLRIRFDVPWVILAFVVTWGNDTFAYFAGHFFGKHKLNERLSPKKTWEGFAGGAVGSVVGALVTKWLLLPELGLWPAVVIGVGGAVLGPLGDLAESMIKRAAGVKDSGKIIPGHGGLLDRIDALLFVGPWIYVCAAAFAVAR
ncbi:MAG TPA: phosphatidate cytidylyltransferase [Anaeromyxobacteraceae bacterium]|nr:phosphatidate cytidylyltransferase [Anaeromyxobacteraceae bacterium]